MEFNIWANFPKYWIYCTEENFDLREEYPVISAVRTCDSKYLPANEDAEDIKKYNIIQYYKMFRQ